MEIRSFRQLLQVIVLLWFFKLNTYPVLGNVVDPNIPLLEEEAQKLSLEDFEGDPIFVQSIDRLNSRTNYRLIQDNVTIEKPVFEREVDDSGKEVVIFRTAAGPPQTGHGATNTYVVLRRRPSNNEYYATYAYTRYVHYNL